MYGQLALEGHRVIQREILFKRNPWPWWPWPWPDVEDEHDRHGEWLAAINVKINEGGFGPRITYMRSPWRPASQRHLNKLRAKYSEIPNNRVWAPDTLVRLRVSDSESESDLFPSDSEIESELLRANGSILELFVHMHGLGFHPED